MNPEVKWLMEYLDDHPILPEMQKAIDLGLDWLYADHGYESKNTRIYEWRTTAPVGVPGDTILYSTFTHIFVGALMHPEGMTYQAMIGYISGNIGCADPLDRAKCAAELIAIAYQCDLIVITKVSDKTMLITTEFELPVEIPEFDKHMPEFRKPRTLQFSPILGNRFKQHLMDTCPEHINRMNAIPLTLEYRIITDLEEMPGKDRELETDEQIEQWEDFKRRSLEAYSKVAKHDPATEPFYLTHSYDTRGRTYCSGYYINYQGASYKKAIVQLADREVVKL